MATLADVLAPVKAVIPDEAKDLRLNLGSVIERSALDLEEALGAALAAAVMARSRDLVEAFEAADELPATQAAGARTAAALMAMNTTWYPFPELSDDAELQTAPAGLRMNAFTTHGGVGRERFELYALAAAIVGQCHTCIASHVAELRKAGRSTEEIRDVGRIAATVTGVAVVLDTMAVPG
ncbi:MAG TPA: carboxymuconolactone decarboxylase family protein [Acidimicrobiales bacterium]|nr:carboxymuconolactone decarboxylase family protein [Acidimicrobiales bacterium]